MKEEKNIEKIMYIPIKYSYVHYFSYATLLSFLGVIQVIVQGHFCESSAKHEDTHATKQ